MPSGELDNARPAGPRLYDYIIILITVTIWGGSFASTKYALAQAEPSLILLLRFLFGIPVLAAGCLFEKACGCQRKRRRLYCSSSASRASSSTRGYRPWR